MGAERFASLSHDNGTGAREEENVIGKSWGGGLAPVSSSISGRRTRRPGRVMRGNEEETGLEGVKKIGVRECRTPVQDGVKWKGYGGENSSEVR